MKLGDLGKKHCEWSAKVTVQNISQHGKEDKEIGSHMGMGQPLAFAYQNRPQKEPKELHRNKTIGFISEAYKRLTRAKRTKVRESMLNLELHQLIELVRDQDRVQEEVQALLGTTPSNKEVGLEADKWARTLNGLRFHSNMNVRGLQQLQDAFQASIGNIQKLEGQDKASAIEQWIDRILDASQGYRVAHSYTRGTHKAPPLPTGLWHK